MLTISIITVVKNNARYVESCLNSVSRQTKEVNHIIIDGLSTDGTWKIVNDYKKKLMGEYPEKANKLHLYSESDSGIYHAMNKGIELASSDIIGFLNADDEYSNEKVIENVLDAFKISNADSCYGDLVYVSPKNVRKVRRYWKSGDFALSKFKWGWMPPHPTFFVKKKIYHKFGQFNLELGSAADYELMLRFLYKYKISTNYIPKVLVLMRSGGKSNKSLKNRIQANKMDQKAWKVNNIQPFPWTFIAKPIRKIPQYFFRSD